MITSLTNPSLLASTQAPSLAAPPVETKLRETFDDFVGQAFFGQMTKAMRSTVDKPAYFHGGRAEEIFQGQLDQALADEMTESAAAEITDPMFELFTLSRT